MNPETQNKHLTNRRNAVIIIAILIMVGLFLYQYIKKNPLLTKEEKNIKVMLETIPKDKQPEPADIQSLKNSIPNGGSTNNIDNNPILNTIPSK